jgi:hypothetical protein
MNTNCCDKVVKQLDKSSCKNHHEDYPNHMEYNVRKCQYGVGYCWQREVRGLSTPNVPRMEV